MEFEFFQMMTRGFFHGHFSHGIDITFFCIPFYNNNNSNNKDDDANDDDDEPKHSLTTLFFRSLEATGASWMMSSSIRNCILELSCSYELVTTLT